MTKGKDSHWDLYPECAVNRRDLGVMHIQIATISWSLEFGHSLVIGHWDLVIRWVIPWSLVIGIWSFFRHWDLVISSNWVGCEFCVVVSPFDGGCFIPPPTIIVAVPNLAVIRDVARARTTMFKWIIAILLGSTVCLTSPVQAQWYAGVDFMVPTRNSTSNTVFQRGQTSTARVSSEVLLGEQRDFDLHFAAAGRVTVGNRSGVFGLEGSYMATTDWTHTGSVFDGSGRLVSPFSLVGATLNPSFDNNTSAVVDYTTKLNTAEMNLTQRVYVGENGNASLLYGARYMSIEESLTYSSSNALLNHNIVTTTDNRLVGPQLGVLIESPLGGGALNLAFKSSLAYNTIDKTTDFDGILGQGSDTDASLMSEIDVHYIFFPTRNLSVRVGYQFLGATDVALATKNFERNLSVLGSGLANVQSDSGVAYHSPYVGVVFAY